MYYFFSSMFQCIIGVILFVILILKNISFEMSKKEKPQAYFFFFFLVHCFWTEVAICKNHFRCFLSLLEIK